MSRGTRIAASAAIAAVCVAGVAIVYFARQPSFDESFRQGCLGAARAATDQQGIPWREVQAAQQRMCDCALNLLKAKPVAEQQTLETSEDKRREFAAEVQQRCQ